MVAGGDRFKVWPKGKAKQFGAHVVSAAADAAGGCYACYIHPSWVVVVCGSHPGSILFIHLRDVRDCYFRFWWVWLSALGKVVIFGCFCNAWKVKLVQGFVKEGVADR